MSRKREPAIDICRVCRQLTKMSFEHLPPQRAFNRGRAQIYGMDAWLRRREGQRMTGGQIQQRGMGAWSLCAKCNNDTGSRYAAEYVQLARAGAYVLSQAPVEELDRATEYMWATIGLSKGPGGRQPFPLRIVKQVVTMLLACNGAEFACKNPELGDFVRDPHCVGLSDEYQLYLALYTGSLARTLGVSVAFTLGGPSVLSTEVASPPFACVLTIDAPPGVVDTVNITPMTQVGFNDRADLELETLIGFGHTPFPMDFRSRAMIERDRAFNEASAA